jgi:hypothetical protein
MKPITLPVGFYKIDGALYEYRGKRLQEAIATVIHGPVINLDTYERDASKGMGVANFIKLHKCDKSGLLETPAEAPKESVKPARATGSKKKQPPAPKTPEQIERSQRIAKLMASTMAAHGMDFDYENDPDTMARINGTISAEEHTAKVEGKLKKVLKKP